MTRTSLIRRPNSLRRLGVLGLVTAAGLAFSATQALAAGETINLAQTGSTAVVGQVVNFTASGTLNPADTWLGLADIYIYVKDGDVDPTCAADEVTEGANSVGTGGNEIMISPSGGYPTGYDATSFDQAFKVTFSGPGHALICGYVTDGMNGTLAATQLTVTVTAAATAPTATTPTTTTPTKSGPTTKLIPNPVRAPWITLSRHVLTCHAGTWLNKPTSYGYGWYLKGRGAKLAAGPTLKVKLSTRGHLVICKVTGRNGVGMTTIPSKAIQAR